MLAIFYFAQGVYFAELCRRHFYLQNRTFPILNYNLMKKLEITLVYNPIDDDHLIHVVRSSQIHSPPGRLVILFTRKLSSIWDQFYLRSNWHIFIWYQQELHSFKCLFMENIKSRFCKTVQTRHNLCLRFQIPGWAQLPALTFGSVFPSMAFSAVVYLK